MTFADEVTTDAPDRWWDTRLAVGAAQPDSSGNAHTGTITGSPVLSADGLTFDNAPTGDDEFIVGDDTYSTPTATFAFEVVLKFLPHDYGRTWLFFAESDGNNGSGVSGFNGSPIDQVAFQWWDGAYQLSPDLDGDPIDDDVLHHVLCEYDGTDAITYVDGVVVETNAIVSAGMVPSAPNTFTLADDLTGGGSGFIGLIRHGIFYDHDLGPTRAAAHAAAALTDDPSPVAGDPMTEGPTVRLVTTRALAVPHQVQRWVLPIICKEMVQTGDQDNVEMPQDVAAVREFFLGLRRTGTPVAFQEGANRHLVVVRDVSFPDGFVEQWGSQRAGLEGILVVTLDSTES